MTPRVFLSSEEEAAIRRHSEEQYPLEACGALLGRIEGRGDWHIFQAAPAPNQHAEDQRRRYQIPPEFQLQMELRARSVGGEVVGYYHSHPDHPARPSEYDRAHAWPGYVYIICSAARGRAETVAAFCLDGPEGSFLPVAIEREGATA